jgi:formyltetrahydrofolate deformylase
MILLISCPDQPGIVARVTDLLYRAGNNILTLEQHVEQDGRFFMRIYVDVSRCEPALDELRSRLARLAEDLEAELSVNDPARVARVAILVSTEDACLLDLLMKHNSGELACEVPLVISDKELLGPRVSAFGIPFHHLPTEPSRDEQERAVLELLHGSQVDVVVLARYMKILSAKFVSRYEDRIINIHHSFLPAFKGARAYHEAWERGVKVIGATAHYVVPELDEGPIIAQDAVPVTHQYSVDQMVTAGRDVERRVLSAAVKAHLEHRIIRHHRRTIVFDP